jgi:hypothetical protein
MTALTEGPWYGVRMVFIMTKNVIWMRSLHKPTAKTNTRDAKEH